MRKTLATLALLAAGFATSAPAQAALRVFACEPEWGALASEIGGQNVEVYVATSAHQDPHHVDARPSLVAQLRKADLVVCTGAGLETGWLPVLLARSANPALKDERLFMAAEKVQRVGAQAQVDRSKGDVHAEGNPHVHLDPRRMVAIGNALAQALSRIDGAHAADYRASAVRFASDMNSAIAGWEQTAAGVRGKAVIVYHDAWPYLLEWLQLEQVATLEPLPGVPPGAQHLAKVAQIAQARNAWGVLHTTYDDVRAVRQVAQQGRTCALELPYTVGGAPGTATLRAFYDVIVKRIAQGCR